MMDDGTRMRVSRFKAEVQDMHLGVPLPEIRLGDFTNNDIGQLVTLLNDESGIAKRVTNIPLPYTRENAREWVRRARSDDPTRLDLGIYAGCQRELIGCISFIQITGHKAQLSWWLGRAYQGHGVMLYAAEKMLSTTLFKLGLERIYARPAADNIASCRTLEKLGFVAEGHHKKEWRDRDGIFHDSITYAIVR